MPYVSLSKTKRVYLEEDLMDWFKKNRQSEKVTEKENTSHSE
jgi:hypothetical protein